MKPTAFTSQYGQEILSEVVTSKQPADLIIALLSISLCFGINRTECAIKNTYAKTQAAQVISMFNTALKLFPSSK